MLRLRTGFVPAQICLRWENKLTSPACNGTIVNDTEMGEVIQLQGDQRKDVQEFLVDKKEGLELDAKTIKVELFLNKMHLSSPNVKDRSMASDPRDLSDTP